VLPQQRADDVRVDGHVRQVFEEAVTHVVPRVPQQANQQHECVVLSGYVHE